MRLTASEIKQQQFKVRFRGFDIEEVDTFLDIVANEIEELSQENELLRSELNKKDMMMVSIKEEDAKLKKIFLSLQEFKENIVSNAEKQASLILKECDLKAKEGIKRAEGEVLKILEDIKRLKFQKRKLVMEIRQMLENQLTFLNPPDEEDEDFDERDLIEQINSKISAHLDKEKFSGEK